MSTATQRVRHQVPLAGQVRDLLGEEDAVTPMRQAIACLLAISVTTTTSRLALITARAGNNLQAHHVPHEHCELPREIAHDPRAAAVAAYCLRLWREHGFHHPGIHLHEAIQDCDAFMLSLTLIHRALTNPDDRHVLMRAHRSVPGPIILALDAVERAERQLTTRTRAIA